MYTEAPTLPFLWEDGTTQKNGKPVVHSIEMRGTFRWELEFLALTGTSFQHACEGMGEQFAEFERSADAQKAIARAEAAHNLDPSAENLLALEQAKKLGPDAKILDPRWFQLCFDLFFSSCAEWRAESGWDRRHTVEGDETRDPRQRGPYLTFVDRLRKGDWVRAQSQVFRLLYLYNYDPGAAASRKTESESLRPSDDALLTSTTA